MRFDSLQIPAFGPFTNFRLSFGKAETDLHLIYGPNEAGKSSLLRAIHNLLYGIPTRTGDNFVHPYDKLLIGATVRAGEEELTFFRKKARQGTLLDADQNTLDESRLRAFCGSVNDEFFTHMFGLSTRSLRDGAAALLSGEGELGTLLFSASLGGSPIDAALERLQAEADQLFAGNGRKANTIVIAKKAFQEFEKQSRELATTANAWKTLRKAIEQAEGDFRAKEEHLTEKRSRSSHLENLIKAIPLVTELGGLDEQLAEITLPELPSDFPERVRKAQENLSAARIRCQENENTLKDKREKLDAVVPYQVILDQATEIESLHQGIAGHLDDLHTRVEKEEGLRQLEHRFENQMEELGLESPEALDDLPGLGAADLASIRELGDTIVSRERAAEQAQANLDQTFEELTEAQAKLDDLGDDEVTPSIRDLASRIDGHQQEARIVADRIEERDQKAADLEFSADQLGVADRDPAEIRKLSVPASVVLEEFREEREKIGEKRDECRRELEQLEEKIVEKESDIEEIAGDIAVHTEEDLRRAREERDAQWKELASYLEQGTARPANELETFEEKILRSDEIADALRNHAEVLGRLATLRHDLTRLTRQRDREAGVLEKTGEELAAWTERWSEQCCFIEDRDFLPSELIEWRTRWVNWCETRKVFDSLETKIDTHRQAEADLLEELRQHLESPEAGFGVLSRELVQMIEAANTARGERKVLSESITEQARKKTRQEAALAEAIKALEAGRARWSEVLAAQRIDDPGSTTAAFAILESRREARNTREEIEAANRGVSALVERIEAFQERLAEQRNALLPDSPELDPQNPDLTESRLWEVLEGARSRRNVHDNLKDEIDALEADLKAKLLVIEAAKKEIETLVAEAKLDSAEELSAAITLFEKRQGLETQRGTTHRTLVGLAGSSPVEDLIAETETAESGSLRAELARLGPEVELLQQERDEARDLLNEEVNKRTELELAKDDAINAKQLAANELARMVTDCERFIRLQHAIAFLEAQVEAYREKSQGPMIEKTSEFFATLTNGSFTGVAAQVDDRDPDRINLVAKRQNPDDPDALPDILHTAALSEGTRDQLYLALRLAAIDIHLENHAPMPLILDDILMTFDDERAESVFEVLKKLSKKTQVLIFTHHRHVAALARKFVPEDQVLGLPIT